MNDHGGGNRWVGQGSDIYRIGWDGMGNGMGRCRESRYGFYGTALGIYLYGLLGGYYFMKFRFVLI